MQGANYSPILAHFSPTYNPQRVFICNYHLWQNVGGFWAVICTKNGQKMPSRLDTKKEIAFYGYLSQKGNIIYELQ